VPWWGGGFALAALLLWFATYRLRDEEIPRIALLTAAFFIASSIHVRVGPTTIHLLLNGLVGVLLGTRAPLALVVALALQAVLLGHGGYQALGINTCIVTLPALLCGALFRALNRFVWLRASWGRGFLVGTSALCWFFGAACSLVLLRESPFGSEVAVDWTALLGQVLQPWLLVVGALFAGGAIWCEGRLEHEPEFPLGLLLGLLSVLITVGLNAFVLILAGETEWQIPALVLVLLHLPFAVVEGVILGFAVGFLARVKPELLGMPRCSAVVECVPASDECVIPANAMNSEQRTSTN
jgi:ABC-type Co2+ transport system permease subunit